MAYFVLPPRFIFGIRFEYSPIRLFALIVVILFHLSVVKVEDYFAAAPYGQGSTKDSIIIKEEEPLNDDIIISRVTRDCPDESDSTLDCSDSMHHNKESLIYPVAQFSTRRTHIPRSSTWKSFVVTASTREVDCDPEDENCEGSAIDPNEDDDDDEDDGEDDEEDDDENENINMEYRTDPGKEIQSKKKTPKTKYQNGASSKTPASQIGGQTSQRHQVQRPSPQGSSQVSEWTQRRGSTSNTPNPLSAAQSPASNSHNTYIRNSQDVSSSSIKDRHFQQLAINMNIVLIAGIAAGIVVLLFILVVAACKFYASSTAPTGAKALTDYHQQRAANKAAYAYEACNTGGKCSSPLLVPSSQQSLPVLNTTSQAGLTSVGSATSTVSKPAKKDVKEWYV